MANIQMIPGASAPNPCPANGRSYKCAANSVVMVPDFDANVLEANGWMRAAGQGSGPTTSRPKTGLWVGFEWFDTTLNLNVKWDGKAWRSHVDGTSV